MDNDPDTIANEKEGFDVCVRQYQKDLGGEFSATLLLLVTSLW